VRTPRRNGTQPASAGGVARKGQGRADTAVVNPDSDVTRYGAPRGDVRTAAAILRAKAARHGVTLTAVSDIDLAAAVVAADGWCAAYRTVSLDRPGMPGSAAARALARILLRAAGQGVPAEPPPVIDPADDPDHLELATTGLHWAGRTSGVTPAEEVLLRAATDLAVAGTSTPAGRYAELLVVVAELAASDV
jgi:hypothetical protein